MIRTLASVASVACTSVVLVIGVSAQQGLSAKAQENHFVLAQDLRRGLERKLQTVVEGLDGVIGYDALDLNSGEEIGHLEQEEFPTASTIKLAILYELCQQAEAGRINLETSALLDRHTVVGGSGILHALGTPTLSLRDHAVLMMTLSDNTATNVLIDAVGMSNVMSRMQSLGLTGIRLRRKMMDTAAAARGDENVATPRDIVRLLRVLHAGEGSNSDGKSAALKILELGAGGQIRLGVPEDVPILNKPGDLEGVRVDAAIVRAKNRPYALAVMTTYLKDENEGGRAITETSRAFYEYFSRLGMGSEYGRQMKR